ncbi:UNKNOWN [Stylonychia lemnae]|uniref:Uncharacterized protein n=1 Tax=Stylonychia lemnae TaxID=5949 RepID=A0A078B5R5_STYLE|nr:UNKNOWN [Stylonychia lemnae]|eukprot:CDW89860.1 UNKNOWN [Stylonychia lemnae]
MIAAIAISLALQIPLKFSMDQVWRVMSVLQLIVNLPFTGVQLTSNVYICFQTLKQISSFQFIDQDTIKDIITKHIDNQEPEGQLSFYKNQKMRSGLEDTLGHQLLGFQIQPQIQHCPFIILFPFNPLDYSSFSANFPKQKQDAVKSKDILLKIWIIVKSQMIFICETRLGLRF